MENRQLDLVQPNVITQARYIFSEVEMQILVFIIRNIQAHMNQNPSFEINTDLFGQHDYKLYFHLSELVDGETNLTRIKRALKDLRHKDFEIDNEKEWFNVGLINYSAYNKELRKWELQVSHKLMPYMVHLATGYTRYQLETVLNLTTNAQRLYMLFSQFHNTGFYKVNAARLRDILVLNDKYPEYRSFKNRVVTSAIKQINTLYSQGKSDLQVILANDKKPRNKEDWDRVLEFNISYTKKAEQQSAVQKQEYLRYAANLMRSIFPTDERFVNELLGFLLEAKQLKSFVDRLVKIEDEAQADRLPLSHFGALVRHIAKQDHGFVSRGSRK